jgi:multicomponent Na+:H+ antiporter subunit D
MNLEQHLPALQVVAPLLSVPVVMLLKPRGFAWLAATAASVVALAIAISMTSAVLGGESIRYLMGSWSPPYGIELKVDSFSAVLLLVITGASTLALIAGRLSLT